MVIIGWLRLSLGVCFLLIGMYLFAVQVFGIFKFRYVLNRMHSAAMGDTLGIGSSLLGLIFLSGLNFTSLKFGLIILFLWCSSPVSSHLISKLQAVTDESLDQECLMDRDVVEKLESFKEGGSK